MVVECVESVQPAPFGQTPDAFFISGLPGAGKSSMCSKLELTSALPRPLADFVVVDVDNLRDYHAQFTAFASFATDRYENLEEWWVEGSNFEQNIFKDPGGLMDVVLGSRRSFIQPAVMRSQGSIEWVQHVISCGFRAHLLLVHVPLDVAKARAAHRATSSFRRTPPAFIDNCEPGLLRHSREIALLCEESGGSVRIIDNTEEEDATKEGNGQVCRSSLALFKTYEMQKLLLSPSRVKGFALAQMNRLPSDTLAGVDCSLAGGAFKCLLQIPDTSPSEWARAQPRDLDIWPVTSADEKLLVARLSSAATSVKRGRWSTCLTLPGPLIVDIVTAYGRDLQATLDHFDIALCAVGVRFISGSPIEVFVHPLAIASVENEIVELLPAAVDSSFMLSTVERLLRYERQLCWSAKKHIAQLRSAFQSKSDDEKVVLIANYKASTIYERDCAAVCSLLGFELS